MKKLKKRKIKNAAISSRDMSRIPKSLKTGGGISWLFGRRKARGHKTVQVQ